MNIILTGRVRQWFEHDLGLIRPTLRAEARGLVSYPTPGPGRPIMWRMPPPFHPLETIAAMRGWGGLEGPNIMREGLAMMCAGELRTGLGAGWLAVTRTIADRLFVTPATIRLLWHVLTPLNVGNTQDNIEWSLVSPLAWDLYKLAAGYGFIPDPPTTPYRPNFWTEELSEGDIEL